jgi:hypothetical protein
VHVMRMPVRWSVAVKIAHGILRSFLAVAFIFFLTHEQKTFAFVDWKQPIAARRVIDV